MMQTTAQTILSSYVSNGMESESCGTTNDGRHWYGLIEVGSADDQSYVSNLHEDDLGPEALEPGWYIYEETESDSSHRFLGDNETLARKSWNDVLRAFLVIDGPEDVEEGDVVEVTRTGEEHFKLIDLVATVEPTHITLRHGQVVPYASKIYTARIVLS